jgi:uncharacterized short protein YbdD (DUF466 family)
MKLLIVLAILLAKTLNIAQDSHSTFSNILNKHVTNGKVDYKKLISDNDFDNYLAQLKNTNPDTIKSTNNKIAFWINAYNAYTLKIIIDNYPLESINDLHSGGLILGTVFSSTIWDEDFVIINNKQTTLNTIEHDVLRKDFIEPRVHFALVCASISCPPLRNEAYEGYKLDSQLTSQAMIFLTDNTKNSFDVNKKEAEISKIFDWFEEDFGDNDDEVLLFLSRFLPKSISNSLKNDGSDWDIDYKDYNWNLNE